MQRSQMNPASWKIWMLPNLWHFKNLFLKMRFSMGMCAMDYWQLQKLMVFQKCALWTKKWYMAALLQTKQQCNIFCILISCEVSSISYVLDTSDLLRTIYQKLVWKN
eukprot:NODE_148_length_15570_cov_0.950100.p12 type:complete len:107 gc:universal NODE_148_length_15570_cov_0.950100:10837-10517(-)